NARLYDALARARDQYRLLFENAVEGIFQLDPDGRVDIVNYSLAEALGYRSTEEFLAEVRYLPTDIAVEPEAIAGVLDAVLEHGSVHAVEFEALKRDGSRTWLELSARALLDESGRPTGLEGSLVDVTERRARDEAEQARELAEEATRAKSYFLASMGHEIRTPMNAILGFSELALETQLEPKQQEYLGTIRDAASALLGIINDVLDLSRIEAGRMELVSGHFDPVQLLSQIEQLFVARAQERGLTLRVEGMDALTEALGSERGLLGDAGRLRQVLVNLVGNALKFTDQGEIALVAQMRQTYASGLELAFEVSDTGTGISEDDLERLWDAFEQLDASTTRRKGGAGLGLAISRQLVLLMGGALSVESTQGVGTRFTFALRMPFSAPSQTEQPMSAPGTRPLAGRDLLLAEDNRINQRLILEFLERSGAHVTVTETGRGALELLRIRRFDAVLMDLHMPELDGIEACRQLRAARWGHDLPVIAVTADAVGDGPLRAREAGFDDIVFRPIDRTALIGALLRLLPGTIAAAPGPAASPAPAAVGTAPAPSAAMAQMKIVPGIDLALGLRNHDHNEGLYLRMLEAFPEHYAEAGRTVRAELAENRVVEAARVVHNVHGVAGSFGAEHLR
ncbi:MAG: ATP-binding protein, partial [Pseudomonadales bacterium]|nr:ATP-binding protein [Pseudomonadales bacterium]